MGGFQNDPATAFKWHIGQIDFIAGDDTRPFSFEVLTDSDLQKLDDGSSKLKAAVHPTPQQRLYDLGGFEQLNPSQVRIVCRNVFGPTPALRWPETMPARR